MKRSKLNPVSKKRAKENRLYLKLRNEYLEEHELCEVCELGDSFDVHHRRGRGIYLCEVEWFLAVCRPCHIYIEKHRLWAREQGYLLDRIGRL